MEYPKINSIYKRTPDGKLIIGDYSTDEIAYLANCNWEAYEKVDGTNTRVIWDGKQFTFKGRNEKSILPDFVVKMLSEKFVPEKGWAGKPPMIIFGESYGRKIQQKGKHYLSNSHNFIIFDINIAGNWLSRRDILQIAREFAPWGWIDYVPLIAIDTLPNLEKLVISGFESHLTPYPEGLVCRPSEQLFDRLGRPIMTKIKIKDFTN